MKSMQSDEQLILSPKVLANPQVPLWHALDNFSVTGAATGAVFSGRVMVGWGVLGICCVFGAI